MGHASSSRTSSGRLSSLRRPNGGPPSAGRVRQPPEFVRLIAPLLPILLIAGLAVLNLFCQARLAELDYESRRLERLGLEQTMRRGELMRARAKLTDNAMLYDYAARRGMVNPAAIKPLRVGLLPAPRVYWALPGEGLPSGVHDVVELGLLPPVIPGSGRM